LLPARRAPPLATCTPQGQHLGVEPSADQLSRKAAASFLRPTPHRTPCPTPCILTPQIREKNIADQLEARRAKNKASRERKAARREERLAAGVPAEAAAKPAAAAAAAPAPAKAAKASKK
jgi:hypothetical protein